MMKQWGGFAHGILWKGASLVSKAFFLFLIVPKLPTEVFAEYVSASTIALLIGLIISAGSSESLPTLIKGRRSFADCFSPIYNFFVAVCLAALALYLAIQYVALLVLAVAVCQGAFLVLSGIIRSTNPSHYELTLNIPSILFLAICLLIDVASYEQLLVVFVVSNILVCMLIAHLNKLPYRSSKRKQIYGFWAFLRLARRGVKMTISNLLLMLNFRGLILFPKYVFGTVSNDMLAIALISGEAVWQLGMVVVNRNYISYCKEIGGNLVSFVVQSTFPGIIMWAGGLFFVIAPIPFNIPKFDWPLVGWALVFFGSMLILMDVRYFLWSRNQWESRIFLVQVLIVVMSFGIVSLLPAASWLLASAVFSVILVLTILMLMVVYGASSHRRGTNRGSFFGNGRS